MGKDVNLNSSQWCDLVFEDKNKEYGAYEMRQTSSNRHIVAFIIMVIFAIFVAILPTLLEAVKTDKENLAGVDEAFVMSEIPVEEEVIEEQIVQETAPPPPPIKSTIQFTPPVIVEDSKVKEDNEIKSQEEFNKTDTEIGKQTYEGTGDKDAKTKDEVDDELKKTAPPPKEEKPLTVVEQMPQYPGGDGELMKFLSGEIKYPVVAAENGIQGRVVVRFVVGKDGKVSDVKVVKSLDPSLDKEAVRVVQKMPNWVPGKQNGRSVAVYYTLPVTFRLQQ